MHQYNFHNLFPEEELVLVLEVLAVSHGWTEGKEVPGWWRRQAISSEVIVDRRQEVGLSVGSEVGMDVGSMVLIAVGGNDDGVGVGFGEDVRP